jgi:hypothetical protein
LCEHYRSSSVLLQTGLAAFFMEWAWIVKGANPFLAVMQRIFGRCDKYGAVRLLLESAVLFEGDPLELAAND